MPNLCSSIQNDYSGYQKELAEQKANKKLEEWPSAPTNDCNTRKKLNQTNNEENKTEKETILGKVYTTSVKKDLVTNNTPMIALIITHK